MWAHPNFQGTRQAVHSQHPASPVLLGYNLIWGVVLGFLFGPQEPKGTL